MCQYGGTNAWKAFCNKGNVKGYEQRVKDNAHTLTRCGKDTYGLRLHERGMCIYFFKDGVMLRTGGKFSQNGTTYDVIFEDGRCMQKRYRGTTMTYTEYKRFLDLGYITKSGEILDADKVKKERVKYHKSKKSKRSSKKTKKAKSSKIPVQVIQVSVTLDENYDQHTAERLQKMRLTVGQCLDNELIGTIPKSNLDILENDKDVIEVIVLKA